MFQQFQYCDSGLVLRNILEIFRDWIFTRNFPAASSCRIATAVKSFVLDPILNTVSGVFGIFFARSAIPNPFSKSILSPFAVIAAPVNPNFAMRSP